LLGVDETALSATSLEKQAFVDETTYDIMYCNTVHPGFIGKLDDSTRSYLESQEIDDTVRLV
jgi:hypothetical protein